MLKATPRTRPALAVVLLFCLSALLLGASSALADAPASVTVRVLGPPPYYEALVPPTRVTTNETPVVKDGNPEHACSGTTAAGALELATSGNWAASWDDKYKYFITGIGHPGGTEKVNLGEAPYANYFWNFWIAGEPSQLGICERQLSSGEQLLFFPECFEGCPGSAPPKVLSIEAPETGEVDRPVTVTVRAYPNGGGAPSPVAGADVGGGGTSAETDFEGHAKLTFAGDGTYTLHATGPSSEEPRAVPAEAVICAHEGDDGTCGTPRPPSANPLSQAPASSVGTIAPYTGRYALVANATGVKDSHVYARGKGPRVLSGEVVAHTSVTSISLRLRRTYRKHCWAYDGHRARLVRVRCRRGSFFRIASGGDRFSYLLPAKLPPGRYVLDIEATDTAGNHTALARGSSRVVFYVK